jgi:propionyl-CoA carboxylase alpha chain
VWVQTALGEVALRELPRFPEASVQSLAGGYTAPMPAKVISVHAAAGQKVTAGDLLLILEAMKMEHRITAAADGVVQELLAAEGAQVEAGQALLVMEGESHG